ncbi:hypothetical protein ACEUBD_15005 [Aeromonas veronii]
MQISNLITKIENNVFSEKELINLFNNATSNNKISEEDKALLIFSIEKNTRLRFPKSAKRIFGAKESFAESKLDKLYQDLCKEFNLRRVRISTLHNETEKFSLLNSNAYKGAFLCLVTYSHLP